MFPNRLEIEDATIVENAAIIDVVKNKEPSVSGFRWNFHLKK
jgi:hypothetical protein